MPPPLSNWASSSCRSNIVKGKGGGGGAFCTEIKIVCNLLLLVMPTLSRLNCIYLFGRSFLMEKIPAFKEASLNNAKF